MSVKRGLPGNLKMRHDAHYVDALTQSHRSVGRILPIDKIIANAAQPRVEFGDLTDLTASIKEKGVLEPLLVKPLPGNLVSGEQMWLIIAGERRWRAAQLAGLIEVPCIELNIDDQEVAEIALIENLQRKDLTVWEEADGLASLAQRFGYTHDDIAKKIGKSRSTVTESLTIATLPETVRSQCRIAQINSKSAILSVARQFDETAMLEHIASFTSAHASNQSKGLSSINTEEKTEETTEISKKSVAHADRSNSSTAFHSADSYPARAYSFAPADGNFRIALKFKKPAEKSEIIVALKEILRELEELQ